MPFSRDVTDFQRKLTPGSERQSLPQNCALALREALRLDARPGASLEIVLVTSSPCVEGEKDEFSSLARMIRDRGASVTVYANAEEKGDYLPLCQSGGRFVAIGKPPAEAGQSDRAGKSASDSGSRSIFDVPESGAGGMHLAGIYSARTRHSIANVLRLGGSRESEACVAEGLSWLARHQADDGHWADHNKCEREQPCPPSPMFNYAAPVAETGLAVLAFQAGGNYHFNGRKYSVAVQRGLDWLIGRQKEDGCLFGTRATWYEHGIATFALAEASPLPGRKAALRSRATSKPPSAP